MIRILTLLLLLMPGLQLDARCNHADAARHRRNQSGAKTTVATPLLNDYDLTYVRIDLALDNRNTSLGGNCLSGGRVVNPGGMSRYAFELDHSLTIDSMHFNGTRVTPLASGTDVYTVTLPATLAAGTPFQARVWYHGTPPNGTGFFTHALNQVVLPTGTNIMFTLSDQYLAKDWWPCKQTLVDKIDSADLWFTVADSLKAGSNGMLERVTPLSGNRSRYEWKTRYPTAYYLFSVSVAPYQAYQQTLRFTGSTDTMPVVHYVYDTASFNPLNKPLLDSTPVIIDYFSTIFGRYPFWKEKYGHCMAPLGGGMEHQTMSTLGSAAPTLIAHELGHQWWGDHVTYASWQDIWLSEGFAAYCEQLYTEHFQGRSAAQAYRTGVFNRVLASPRGAVYVDDTNDVSRVFSSRLTYDKGAAVAHMLRYMAPNDAAYFAGLRTYQQRYAFGLAATDSLKAIMEAAYGYPLDSFFRQWVYGEGYPTYSLLWNQAGSSVFVQLRQAGAWPASVAAFDLPVPLRLIASGRDTIVYARLRTADSLFRFSWDGIVTGVQVDPENQILNRTGLNSEEPGLRAGGVMPGSGAVVYPNPTEQDWWVRGLAPGQELLLLDAGGRKVIGLHADGAGTAHIDSTRLAPGIYTLRSVESGAFMRKLSKR